MVHEQHTNKQLDPFIIGSITKMLRNMTKIPEILPKRIRRKYPDKMGEFFIHFLSTQTLNISITFESLIVCHFK